MKILALDIETRPAVVYTWSLWQPIIGVEQIIDPGGMFCFAAKWIGKRGTKFYSDHEHGHEEMLKEMWSYLDDADAVVHFNGASFDIRHIQREFMEHKMLPPSPVKQIDLLKTVKKQGRFLSNKLAHVGPQLGLEGKVSHEGFSLWKKCMDGDEKAWRRMKRYNVRDVTLLEDAYDILLPWIVSHPSHASFQGKRVCPKCGGNRLESRGSVTTTMGRFPKVHCLSCGAWSRLNKRIDSTDIVQL